MIYKAQNPFLPVYKTVMRNTRLGTKMRIGTVTGLLSSISSLGSKLLISVRPQFPRGQTTKGRRVARACVVGCMCRVTVFAGLWIRGSLPNSADLKQDLQLTMPRNILVPWALCRSHYALPSALGEHGQWRHHCSGP